MSQHIPRKRFGQHFLVDPDIIAGIIRAIRPRNGEHLVEIGPGLGALTQPLLDSISELTVIELDRDIVARLQKRYPPARLHIHAGDALAFDFASLPGPLRIVGNLPYNISTPLLFHLAEFSGHIADIHVMLQKEVVDRMTAPHDSADYGRLSVMLQYRFEMESLFDVPPDAFDPPPKVDSAVVRMVPRNADQLALCPVNQLEKLVTTAFSQRRKTLRNTIGHLITDAGFTELGIDPKQRAETLAVADFIRLTNWLINRQTTTPY